MDIEDKLRQIEAKIAQSEELKHSRIEQHKQSLRSHTDYVHMKLQTVREASNTMGEFFTNQKKYYEKIEKSMRRKEKHDKERLEELRTLNDKRTDGVLVNLKDLKARQREQFQYYDKRLKERINKVDQVKTVLKEDIETRKELSLLRKADQEENFMRG